MSDTESTSKKSTAKTDTKTDAKSESKSETKPASTSAEGGGKSAKESVGGAAVGHYGYFSNIKTPEYKSGWDDIWGKKKKAGGKKKPAAKKKAAPKKQPPVTISLDFEDLPEDLRDGLADLIRAELKKNRVSYDARAKKGDVDWTIDCEVRR